MASSFAAILKAIVPFTMIDSLMRKPAVQGLPTFKIHFTGHPQIATRPFKVDP